MGSHRRTDACSISLTDNTTRLDHSTESIGHSLITFAQY